MQLSLHADYALRLLIYLGTHPNEVVTTQQVSAAYGISRNHLVRVVQTLAHHGYVKITVGRSGGVALARDAETIRLGQVVRDAEVNLNLVECFDPATNTCPIARVCGLQTYLSQALEAFLANLDQRTLADLLTPRQRRNLSDLFVQIDGNRDPKEPDTIEKNDSISS